MLDMIDPAVAVQARRGFTGNTWRKMYLDRCARREIEAQRAADLVLQNDREATQTLLRHRGMPSGAVMVVAGIADRARVSLKAMLTSKKPSMVCLRWEAMYRLKTGEGLKNVPSFLRLSEWFGREHTSVIYAVSAYAIDNGLPPLTSMDAGKKREGHREKARAKAAAK